LLAGSPGWYLLVASDAELGSLVPAADFRLPAAAGSGKPEGGSLLLHLIGCQPVRAQLCQNANNPSRIVCLALHIILQQRCTNFAVSLRAKHSRSALSVLLSAARGAAHYRLG
jgi:hypothetical protein